MKKIRDLQIWKRKIRKNNTELMRRLLTIKMKKKNKVLTIHPKKMERITKKKKNLKNIKHHLN